MKKQTAVEWLVEQLNDSGIPLLKDELEFIKQAKEIEKEQICHAYRHAQDFDDNEYEYYNETFKSE